MPTALPATNDLLELTAALVEVPSVSHHEAALVELIEADLRAMDHLDVERVGDNLVARTNLGRPIRVILAGHTDTVPPSGGASRPDEEATPVDSGRPVDAMSDQEPEIDGDVLIGLGAADMKGGLAVMLDLARSQSSTLHDVTYVFYAREEVASVHSGLQELLDLRPELLEGDVAILGEPTAGAVEAGCQGTLRLEVMLRGRRAHTARPWTGENAIHRLGALLQEVAVAPTREVMIGGCQFRESLQAVFVDGGTAGNVVPDSARLVLNHRFAPDRTGTEAEAWVRSIVEPFMKEGDTTQVTDLAPGALPAVGNALVQKMISDSSLEVRSKLGWTDVARFTAAGVPAVNFGPGDPLVAHTSDERVHRSDLDHARSVLGLMLGV